MTELDINKTQQRPLDIPEFLKDRNNKLVTMTQTELDKLCELELDKLCELELDKLCELHKHAKHLAFLHGVNIGVCTASTVFIIVIVIVIAGISTGGLPW